MLGKVWPEYNAAFPDFFSDNALNWWSQEVAMFHDKVLVVLLAKRYTSAILRPS